MTDIVPAILPESYDDLSTHLIRVRGAAHTVQIDICDGIFVQNRTWPMHPSDRAHFAEIIKGEEGLPYWQDFNFEVDLMVHTPEKFLSWWIAAGITRAVIHLESRHDIHACRDATGGSVELGLGIDLDPQWEKMHSAIAQVDYIQLMGIARLGYQGQSLDERVYPLIRKIKAEFPDVTLQIDGGVNEENAPLLLDSGADRLVVGSAIFGAEDPKEVIHELQSI